MHTYLSKEFIGRKREREREGEREMERESSWPTGAVIQAFLSSQPGCQVARRVHVPK